MLLYHGTTKTSAKSICKGINLKVSQGRLDFGKGFYLTANKGQARVWAKRKSFPIGTPVVIEFDANLESLLINKYSDMTDLWAEEIYRQRVLGIDHFDVDCIIGPIADRRVREDALDCEEGKLSKFEFLQNISEKSLGMQYVFKTEKSLSYLKILQVEVF